MTGTGTVFTELQARVPYMTSTADSDKLCDQLNAMTKADLITFAREVWEYEAKPRDRKDAIVAKLMRVHLTTRYAVAPRIEITDSAEMTDDVAEAATWETSRGCDKCGADCIDLHAVNSTGDHFYTECAVCGDVQRYEKPVAQAPTPAVVNNSVNVVGDDEAVIYIDELVPTTPALIAMPTAPSAPEAPAFEQFEIGTRVRMKHTNDTGVVVRMYFEKRGVQFDGDDRVYDLYPSELEATGDPIAFDDAPADRIDVADLIANVTASPVDLDSASDYAAAASKLLAIFDRNITTDAPEPPDSDETTGDAVSDLGDYFERTQRVFAANEDTVEACDAMIAKLTREIARTFDVSALEGDDLLMALSSRERLRTAIGMTRDLWIARRDELTANDAAPRRRYRATTDGALIVYWQNGPFEITAMPIDEHDFIVSDVTGRIVNSYGNGGTYIHGSRVFTLDEAEAYALDTLR